MYNVCSVYDASVYTVYTIIYVYTIYYMYRMAMASRFVPLVLFLMYLFWPVSYPLGKILHYIFLFKKRFYNAML